TTDAAVLAAGRLAVVHAVALLRTLNQAIADCEQQLTELLAKHPDAQLFASFPGAGKSLVPRLIAAFGTDRGKFASAQDLQQLRGTATRKRFARWPSNGNASCSAAGKREKTMTRTITSNASERPMPNYCNTCLPTQFQALDRMPQISGLCSETPSALRHVWAEF